MSSVPTLIGLEAGPPSGKPPRCLIIMLHGAGLDGSDLFRFAPHLHALLPAAHISAPHAPSRFDLGRSGRQWFSLQGMGPDTRLKGVLAAAPVVERFIEARLARTSVPPNRLVLYGFSQGAMIALYVGLRRETPPAAIIAHSGMVVDQALLPAQIRSRPPVLLTHGDADDVISPLQLGHAARALGAVSVSVEAHLIPGLAHVMNEATISIGRDFLLRTLAPTAA